MQSFSLETGDFVSKAPMGRQATAPAPPPPPRPRKAASPQRQSRYSPLLCLCACILFCGLLLGTVLSREPFLSAMKTADREASLSGQDILGRLRFLCAEFVSVFRRELLVVPLDGPLAEGFADDTGFVVFSGAAGCEVHAAAAGTVEAVSVDESGGTVTVTHKDGTTAEYGLLGSIVVEQGQPIEASALLGTTPSGKLRFFYRVGGAPTDPLPYFGLTVH